MRVTTITVTYGRKLNLGDYNNANLEVTLGCELEPDETADIALFNAWEVARESVKGQALRLTKKGGQQHE